MFLNICSGTLHLGIRMTRAVERKAITAPRAMAENKKQMCDIREAPRTSDSKQTHRNKTPKRA